MTDFTAHLEYWLRTVSSHATRAFGSRLEQRGVTAAEWVFLRELSNYEAISPVNLASTLGMTRGGVTKLANRLIEKNLVLRADDPDDGRAKILNLSAAGRQIIPELSRIADENDREFFSSLSIEERDTLTRILQALVTRKRLRHVSPID